MKAIRTTVAILVASGLAAVAGETNRPTAPARAPAIAPGFVGTPAFDTQAGEFSAGTAFFAKLPGDGKTVLVTAQHIFGPTGGLEAEVPRERMAGFSKRMTLRDLVQGRSHATRIGALTLPASLDLAVFTTTPGVGIKPRPFAKVNPKMGDTLWLVASLSGQPRNSILYRGTVVAASTDELKCKFDKGDLVMRGASGAPYLNAQGEVAGLHTGSYKDPGNIAGAVLPAEAIVGAVQAALGAAAPERAGPKNR